MPKLSATRTYVDEQSPVQSDFDAFIDDIEILVNTIQLDNDNFQSDGIDASLKIVDETVTANQIRNNNLPASKLAANAVSTEKFEDRSVTEAKLANGSVTTDKVNSIAGALPPGAVQMFHSFNSTVDVPRNWMICNGDVINETNYDTIHGAGAYAADNISTSPLLNKNLPDMADKYAVGVADTIKDGAAAIASVGNTDHETNFSHTHETLHTHVENTNTGEFRPNSTGGGFNDEWWYTPNGVSQVETATEAVTSGTGGSAALDIQPESIELIYLLKVK